jgi:hypothetical protein
MEDQPKRAIETTKEQGYQKEWNKSGSISWLQPPLFFFWR